MMGRRQKRQLTSERQAQEWFLELKGSDDVPPKRWQAFMAWLREDPRHEALLGQYELIWEDLASLEDSRAFLDYAYDIYKPGRRRLFPWRRACLAGAAICFVVLGLTWMATNFSDYATGATEERAVTLHDGSILLLHPSTSVTVRYYPWERAVLLKTGEAQFTVEHYPWRPFWVTAGPGRVRAVGTKFIVSNDRDNIAVTLIEGRVLVNTEASIAGEKIQQSQILFPGQITRFNASGVQTAARVESIPSPRAPIAARLSFTNAPLADVVAELNRYSSVPILLGQPELADMRISAYFDSGNIDEFIASLENVFGIVHQNNGQAIVLTLRAFKSP
jgi:transmembrane sensor